MPRAATESARGSARRTTSVLAARTAPKRPVTPGRRPTIRAVSGLTLLYWNDSERRVAISSVRHKHTKEHHKVIDKVRQMLRRLDRWTLTVFNPYYASDHRH